ncbi:GNAT family N-acetyltransferase [Cronobacter sakazakii]|uniref:GNAT family N-acetyltransferase n=1 Tax=Cronobacter sakazakii TaxID=28141 RepID=UPI000DA11D29|nr:GNAT family N-acetyltransferase [Cronobacter sakazakii]MCI0305365.1 GNAT family N-acetyltransferase [Cronobacter sakazakii]
MEYQLTGTADEELKARIKKQVGLYNAKHMTSDPQELIISVTDASLMAMAEAEGRKRGCKRVFVDTFSFQAPDFYRKQGYDLYGVAPDYRDGHSRFYFSKAPTMGL